jgi:N-acetylglucosaminyldiphosphoundecaprenol N-acetyl-beta-D-mannosaminyltransferase
MPHVIELINAFAPDILFVGLGDPLQQHWVETYRDQLNAPAILTCGGLFDWVSGDNRRAPRWMISSGFEWLWRLMIEPRRLASRYLIGNPVFLFRLARQVLRTRPESTVS